MGILPKTRQKERQDQTQTRHKTRHFGVFATLWRETRKDIIDVKSIKIATYNELQVAIKVEAAGIEPASRDASMQASTCVVDYLIFAANGSNRRDLPATRRKPLFNLARVRMTPSGPELATDFWTSPAKLRSQGYLYLGGHCEVFLSK